MLAACGEEVAGSSQLDLQALDRAADPCTDFYQFACGGWIAAHPLPADAVRVGSSSDAFYAALPLIESIVNGAQAGSSDPLERAIGKYREACLRAPATMAARQRLRALAVEREAIASLEDLARMAEAQTRLGSYSFFGWGVEIDPGDTRRRIMFIGPGGFELPDRSYYLEAEHAEVRSEYRTHMIALSRMVIGTAIDADAVIRVETALAMATPAAEDLRDPEQHYHLMTLDEVVARAPSFPWAMFFEQTVYGPQMVFNVEVPAYLDALEIVLATTPLRELVSYLEWQLIQDRVGQLDQAVLDQNFHFWKRFSGRAAQSDREWTCFLATESALDEAVARLFVERRADQRLRDAARVMAEDVKRAFGKRIDAASWLDAPTRAEAQMKLANVGFDVGRPVEVPISEPLALEGEDYFEMVTELVGRRLAISQARLAQPVDRSQWSPSPLTANAYFSYAYNSIGVGAIWLAPPYMVDGASKARNYGALGTVIGHELTHGFDDAGRHFDRDGNLRNWWSAQAAADFQTRAQCVVEQFDRYEALPGEFVNGELTLGENIADLGGIATAYDAAFAAGDAGSGGDGFTAEQVFFLAYAQKRCENARPEWVASGLISDPHSPSKARVNLTLSNLSEFADAFACTPNPQPCAVW